MKFKLFKINCYEGVKSIEEDLNKFSEKHIVREFSTFTSNNEIFIIIMYEDSHTKKMLNE